MRAAGPQVAHSTWAALRRDARREHLFTVVNIRRVGDLFFDANSRLRAVQIMAPRTVDPQNSSRLEDMFWDANSQRAVREMFRGL